MVYCGVLGARSEPEVEGRDEPREIKDVETFFLRDCFCVVDGSVGEWSLDCAVDGLGLWRGCRVATGGEVDPTVNGGFGFLGSKVILVGVIAVETSDIESFRIRNCGGDAGGEADRVNIRLSSPGADDGVVVRGAGKSEIPERGGAEIKASIE